MRRQRGTTIKALARKAGVSPATVSRVLNHHPAVSDTMRLRVLRRLGTAPDPPEPSPGLIVPDITNPFYAETAKIIIDVCQGRGDNVILCNSENLPALYGKQIRAARDVTAHMIGLGHRRIGFIAGPPQASTAHERVTGHRAALDAAGIEVDEEFILDGRYQAQAALRVAETLLAAEMAELAATWMLEIAQDPARFAREPFQYVIRPTLMIRRTCGAVR